MTACSREGRSRATLDILARLPRIVLFTTERCSFCDRVKMLLARKGVSYDEVELPRDDMESRRQLVGGDAGVQARVAGARLLMAAVERAFVTKCRARLGRAVSLALA